MSVEWTDEENSVLSSLRFGSHVAGARLAELVAAREAQAAAKALRDITISNVPREVLMGISSNVRHNVANTVAQAIWMGRLDGTNSAAVAAAIRASTPEEFEAACRIERGES